MCAHSSCPHRTNNPNTELLAEDTAVTDDWIPEEEEDEEDAAAGDGNKDEGLALLDDTGASPAKRRRGDVVQLSDWAIKKLAISCRPAGFVFRKIFQ